MKKWKLWFRILLWFYAIFTGISALQFTGAFFYLLFNLFTYLGDIPAYGSTIIASLMLMISGISSIFEFFGAFFGIRHDVERSNRFLLLGIICFLLYLIVGPAFLSLWLNENQGQSFNTVSLISSLLFSVGIPAFIVWSYRKLDLLEP